jgi:hypothetical protein
MRRWKQNAIYLSQRLNLRLELVGVVLVLLDCAQQQIDLGDGNLGEGTGLSRTAGTGAGTRAQRAGVGRVRFPVLVEGPWITKAPGWKEGRHCYPRPDRATSSFDVSVFAWISCC